MKKHVCKCKKLHLDHVSLARDLTLHLHLSIPFENKV